MTLKLNSTAVGTVVKIRASEEQGVVTGFAQHQRLKSKQFFVEYKAADGRASEAWFHEDQLIEV